MKEAASNLYKTLRKIKKLNFKKIYVTNIPNVGAGIAINDRLKRAAKKVMKLEVLNLSKKFNDTIAVNNINFSIEKNKTLGLLGPNGCGKTTSIGMMLGLITPSEGKILINDQELNKNNRINLLSIMNFASPYIELPKKLTVFQNLNVYAKLYGVENVDQRIDEMVQDLI